MSAPIGPYSPLMRMGNLVFISGQIGNLGPVGVEGSLLEQVDAAFGKLSDLLQSAELSVTNIAKTTVFLTDMADFAAMNERYAEYFGDHRPARSTIGVAALPGGARFEIEAVAVVEGE